MIAGTKASYLELWLADRSVGISEESLVLLEQFAASAASRYSVGKSSQQDALKAQVELAKVDNELIMLEQRRLTTQARLNVLLNRDPKEELGPPEAEDPVRFERPLEEFYLLAQIHKFQTI